MEIDKETGVVEPIDYAAVVDCGTVVNPNLARVQTEGESPRESEWRFMRISFTAKKGKNYSNSFMQYKIPSRLDVGEIRVEFESSYEPTGPFGAKSIGRSLSILRLLQFQMQFKMQSGNCEGASDHGGESV